MLNILGSLPSGWERLLTASDRQRTARVLTVLRLDKMNLATWARSIGPIECSVLLRVALFTSGEMSSRLVIN